MAKLDDLEFRITADMGQLGLALNRGAAQVGQFAAQTATSFDRVNRQVGRTITSVRSLFALFGVRFGVTALSSWISNAVRAAEATGNQSDEVRELSAVMRELKGTSEALAIAVGSKLTPAMGGLAAVFHDMKVALDPTEFDLWSLAVDRAQAKVMGLDRDIQRNIANKNRTFFGLLPGAADQELKMLQARYNEAMAELQRLRAEKPGPPPGRMDGLEPFDLVAIGRRAMPAPGGNIFEETRKAEAAKRYEDNLRAAQQLTERMKTDVEQQVDAWHEAQRLFEGGFISAETLHRVGDAMLQPIEVTVHRMKEIKQEVQDTTKQFGATFGNALQSTLANAFSGIETDFKSLMKRMVAELLASGLVGLLGKSLGGKGGALGAFFSGMAPAGRATGGDVSGGEMYKVHRGEAFFSPGMNGRVGPAGGVTVQQAFYSAAGLPPQWDAEMQMMTQRAAAEAYRAVMSSIGGRR